MSRLAIALSLMGLACVASGCGGRAHRRTDVVVVKDDRGPAVAVAHVHGHDCGHYWHGGGWREVEVGHVHVHGCGHVKRDGFWLSSSEGPDVKVGRVEKPGVEKTGVKIEGAGGREIQVRDVEKADGTEKRGVHVEGKHGGSVDVRKVETADGDVKKGVKVEGPGGRDIKIATKRDADGDRETKIEVDPTKDRK